MFPSKKSLPRKNSKQHFGNKGSRNEAWRWRWRARHGGGVDEVAEERRAHRLFFEKPLRAVQRIRYDSASSSDVVTNAR
jgi:hypothetical protein